MKKFLIVLLAALLLVSFTSCDNQKKIDEAVAKEEAKAAEAKESLLSFYDTYNIADKYKSLVREEAYSIDLSDYNKDGETDAEKEAIGKVIYSLLYYSNVGDYQAFNHGQGEKKITSATGTVKVELSDDGNSYTFTAENVSIKASYTPATGKSDHYKKIDNATLTLDGIISVKYNITDEEKGSGTEVGKVTELEENGTSYKDIEYTKTYTDSYTGAFTEALCDGKNVDCDILTKTLIN